MRAHSIEGGPKNLQPVVQTFDGKQLTIAQGEWRKKGGLTIELDDEDSPPSSRFEGHL